MTANWSEASGRIFNFITGGRLWRMRQDDVVKAFVLNAYRKRKINIFISNKESEIDLNCEILCC